MKNFLAESSGVPRRAGRTALTLRVCSAHRPRVHGSSCARRNATTIRRRAWMFCRARFSAAVPPSSCIGRHAEEDPRSVRSAGGIPPLYPV